MKKGKMLISLIVMMVVLIVCSSLAFATDAGPIKLTSDNSASNNAANNSANRASNTPTQITAGGNSSNNASNNAANNSANRANTAGNSQSTSSYGSNNSSNQSGSLPYTGSSYSVIFVIVALGVSAIYAYKKVSDYNM